MILFPSAAAYLPLLLYAADALVSQNDIFKVNHGNLCTSRKLGGGTSVQHDLVEGAWIIEFRPKTAKAAEKAITLAKENNGNTGFIYENVLRGFVYHGEKIEGIRRNPNVLSVTPDSMVRAALQTTMTGNKRIFQLNKNYVSLASSGCFCDAVIAILDTGVDFGHPDLRVNTSMSVDCTVSNSTTRKCIQDQGQDDNGHGTHVAGIVGAIDNDEGVLGVCPGAEIWSVKVLDQRGIGRWSAILAALDWITSHADSIDVVNMSFGNPGCYVPLCNAIGKAKDAGIAFAVAAGNGNTQASDFMPACCEGVMVVSALGDTDGRPGRKGPMCRRTKDDTIARFSNYGEAVDIAAPGVCIKSTYMNGGYATLTGTSMASAHVAGALAVLASNNLTGDVDEMYRTLTSNGNYRFQDKVNDTYKEPLLDLRNIADAKMTGEC